MSSNSHFLGSATAALTLTVLVSQPTHLTLISTLTPNDKLGRKLVKKVERLAKDLREWVVRN